MGTGLRLLLPLALAICAAPAWADTRAPLDVGVVPRLAPAVREAASLWVGRTGRPVAVHTYPRPRDLEFAAQGEMDVLIASSDRRGELFVEGGWVDPASRGELIWQRMAVIVPRTNPKGIWGLEDLDRPGLRWAIAGVCPWRTEELREEHGERFVLLSDDVPLALDLLAEGRLDAVLAWDTAVAGDPRGFAAIRLPSSQHGPAFAAAVPVYVATGAKDQEAAARLVEFLTQNVHARDVYLAHGYMLDDGAAAARYDDEAAPRFARVYANIARQVVDDYKITRGRALDIGCGPGQLTLELARITELEVVGLDIEPEAVAIARGHADAMGLDHRVSFVAGDAHSLPFSDDSFDLVFSRGTLPFLRDHALALQEVYRVLRPGGVAFLGGGMGRDTPRAEAAALSPVGMPPALPMSRDPNRPREECIFPFPVGELDPIMTRAGIPRYRVIHEGGRWVEFRK